MDFATKRLSEDRDAVAPDGSEVRLLLELPRGSMAHFRLPAGEVSVAVRHRTVEEIWYVLGGRGEMWRRSGDREETVPLEPGVCLSIPTGTDFQFRAGAGGPLSVLGVTMPPWPGSGEAVATGGCWTPTVPPGAS